MTQRPTLIIPTNRPHYSVSYLTHIAHEAIANHIALEFYDSSGGGNLQNTIKNYATQGITNFHYVKSSHPQNSWAIDEKVLAGCRKMATKDDTYAWFSTDAVIPKISSFTRYAKLYPPSQYDMLVFSVSNDNQEHVTKYSSPYSLYKDWGWAMTFLGSTLIASRHLQKMVDRSHQTLKTTPFWYPMAVLIDFADTPDTFSAAFIEIPNAFVTLPERHQPSFWLVGGNALWQWGDQWVKSVESMPAQYNSVKNHVMLSHDLATRIFSFSSLLKMAPYGNLTSDKINDFKPFAGKVTHTPLFLFYLAMYIHKASPSLSRKLARLIRNIKRLPRRVKRIVRSLR